MEAGAALEALENATRDCRRCGLCQHRSQVVFGVGSPQADLMFVGEGPGFHEDRLGEPFVGQAGKLLNELLAGIGLRRSEVYIANVVKCRPPENRDPAPDEIEACSPHLLEQIAIIRPTVICTLGRFATKLLAETELSITAIHGKAKERTLGGVRTLIFPVFHPAAALYTPANRQVLVDDFAKLRRLLERGLEALGPNQSFAPCSPEQAEPLGQAAGPGSAAADRPAAQPKPASPRQEQLPLW
jgi:uracil-DNA glycosylase